MNKRIFSVILALMLALGTLSGCAAAIGSGAENGGLSNDARILKVAASAKPHADILKQAKPILAEQGIDLQITVFNDYLMPNEKVESEEFDANYFQHQPFLDSYNEEKGTHLVSVGQIHYEAAGIYPGEKKSLKDISKGDTVVVPDDPTNEARALLLLQDNGIITLKEDAGLTATKNDIVDNPYDITIVELEAAKGPRAARENSYVVLNANYALEAGYSVERDSLAYEKADSEGAGTYVNIVAVKEKNKDDPAVKALVEALTSDEIKEYIKNTYDGSVIPYTE